MVMSGHHHKRNRTVWFVFLEETEETDVEKQENKHKTKKKKQKTNSKTEELCNLIVNNRPFSVKLLILETHNPAKFV